MLKTSPSRSERALFEQVATIERYLGSGFRTDDAAATASRGFRMGVTLPARQAIAYLEHPERYGPVPSSTPREPCCAECRTRAPDHSQPWEDLVCSEQDRWPLYLEIGLPLELQKLAPLPRLILLRHCEWGWSFERIAASKGPPYLHEPIPSAPTCWRLHRKTLEELARAMWDDEGAPIWTHVA